MINTNNPSRVAADGGSQDFADVLLDIKENLVLERDILKAILLVYINFVKSFVEYCKPFLHTI